MARTVFGVLEILFHRPEIMGLPDGPAASIMELISPPSRETGPASHLFWMVRECDTCEFRDGVKLNHSANSGMYMRTASPK